MAKKKGTEPFVMLHRAVLNSFAWRALSESARKVIYRVILEWMAHAGKLSTDIPVTKENFIEYGLHHNAIAPAQREACALGLLLLSTRGRAGNAEFRAPHKWALLFLKDERGKYLGTDWQRFESLDEAKAAANKARALKDTNAVAMGKRRAQVNRSPVPSDGPETSTVTRYRKPPKAA
jgi:hypothetical protein